MKRLIAIILILAIAVFSALVWWTDASQPVDPNNKNITIFTIEEGKGVRDIASNLKAKGLIKSPVAFFVLVRQQGLDKKIQAGRYRLSPSMNMSEVAQNLTHGSFDTTITFTEGQRAAELAEILKENISSYNPSWNSTLEQNEGYLFPDTYDFAPTADIMTIIRKMRARFDEIYSSIDTSKSKLSKPEIVTLASLIEREAITNEERPVIAGILMNRLNAGIALQVDATIQYAKGKNAQTNKWWDPVFIEEYKSVKSDYNTYLFAGLPPGPISNPGLESLKAAANPVDTDYMFYIHGKDGIIRYAKTSAEHGANIEKYL
jgi:UPF0755 protein